ncbi:hypothetical protein PYCCODRAFT_1431171 [Trametes coccinea BRFM310]|uniref:Uncharacterized protein n=1 Tax=Trametes coccinea (strain BRFM310) TaxID=1353009 RepID=A0A1Y2J0Z0_TRAC3|nr:hypothetical protein PYCCODRAFT_1431171 [Trametes coccinea BRFM310]
MRRVLGYSECSVSCTLTLFARLRNQDFLLRLGRRNGSLRGTRESSPKFTAHLRVVLAVQLGSSQVLAVIASTRMSRCRVRWLFRAVWDLGSHWVARKGDQRPLLAAYSAAH